MYINEHYDYYIYTEEMVLFTMGFIDTFIEVYNVFAALIIIFLIGQILFMTRRVDRDLLKARLFLDESVMQRTWTYISIAGAAFALNSLIKLMVMFSYAGRVLRVYYITDFTQIIFIIAFILAVYSWYMFIGGFVNRREDMNELRKRKNRLNIAS